jgi:hypothetical protein
MVGPGEVGIGVEFPKIRSIGMLLCIFPLRNKDDYVEEMVVECCVHGSDIGFKEASISEKVGRLVGSCCQQS